MTSHWSQPRRVGDLRVIINPPCHSVAAQLHRYILVHIMNNIDWSKFTGPEDTCHCRCGKVFRSHVKYVMAAKRMITRRQCPQCGKNNDCWRVTSDPETIEI